MRTDTARPANATGTLQRLRSSTTRQGLETRSICSSQRLNGTVIDRKASCSSMKTSGDRILRGRRMLRAARSRRRLASQAFSASSEPDMLMAPVELRGLARGETQRNERASRSCCPIALPNPGIAPHSIVAAFVSETAECFEDPDQRQPFGARLRLTRCEQLIERVLGSPYRF
jgi:hypothetical protein